MTNALIGGALALSVILQAGPARNPVPQQTLNQIHSKALAAATGQAVKIGRVIEIRAGGRVEQGPCNMPMIRGDARMDPKSIVPMERGNTEHKIRAVEPTVCWQRQSGRR